MHVDRAIFAVVCILVLASSAPLARPQDATSANLPERFETGEATPTPKSKKKKAEPIPEIAGRTSTQKPVPVTEQTPAAEEQIAASVEKSSVQTPFTPARIPLRQRGYT